MLKFLDKKNSKKYFIKCDYLKKIGSQEINLRSTRYMETAITRIELMENYFESVLSFSSEEKMYIEKFIKKQFHCFLTLTIFQRIKNMYT